MRNSLAFALVVTSSLVLSGCAVRVGDLTMISNKSINLDTVDLDTVPQVKGISGESSRMILLFIPLGVPTLEEAIDDALAKGDGDLMLDPVIYTEGWWFLIGQNTIRVEGTVAKTRGGGR